MRAAARKVADDPVVPLPPASTATAATESPGVNKEVPGQPADTLTDAEPDADEGGADVDSAESAESTQTSDGIVADGSGEPSTDGTDVSVHGGGSSAGVDAEPDFDTAAPTAPDTGAGEFGTGDLVLIDLELAEHQRWAGATGRVGEIASLRRAEFVAESAGSGFIEGAASGAKTGLGIGLGTRVATRFVPAIGPVIGAGMALHGLVSGADQTIKRIGEGSDVYETLANTIAGVSAMVDTATQVLNVINGIVGIVEAAAAVIAGGAVVAAFFTFGATLGVAAVAGDVVITCHEISVGINTVTTVLDAINQLVLQPSVTLFQALHTFTSAADPSGIEAQGKDIASAASASGGALGGWAGGKAAHLGAKPKTHPEDPAPQKKPEHDLPPVAPGDGPSVRSEAPSASAPLSPPAVPASSTSQGSAGNSSTPVGSTGAGEGGKSQLRALTAPLELQGIKGKDPVPKGLDPGAIGTYARAVPNPHEAALASNPPGAPGATAGGGRMPQEGRKSAGVYGEHQTSAAVAHEVLPGHQKDGPQGQPRQGSDTKDALVIALPESVKSGKDAADAALLAEIRARKSQGEEVPAIEAIARSTQITQDAISQSGADVPGQQVSRNFLAEIDQFNDPRFGYQEVRPGEPLPPGHPFADTSPADLDTFVDRTFDPFIVASEPSMPPQKAASAIPPNADLDSTQPVSSSDPTGATAEKPAMEESAAKPVIGEPATRDKPVARIPKPKIDPLPDGERVENVNPAYEPPPATPAEIVAIQNQILGLLAARAAAERDEQHETERLERSEENRAPIERTLADTAAGITAVQAHEAAVARREAANHEQQARQQESEKLVAGYPSCATGLAVLTVPLAAWAGFTGLASHLPGEAGRSMLRMNEEAKAMQDAFATMGTQMLGVESSGPANTQQLQADQDRLAATKENASSSISQLRTTSAGATAMQDANDAALAEATQRKEAAADRAGDLGDAATESETRAESLSGRLRTWAVQHAKARQVAVAATARRLRAEGRTVVRSSDE